MPYAQNKVHVYSQVTSKKSDGTLLLASTPLSPWLVCAVFLCAVCGCRSYLAPCVYGK